MKRIVRPNDEFSAGEAEVGREITEASEEVKSRAELENEFCSRGRLSGRKMKPIDGGVCTSV